MQWYTLARLPTRFLASHCDPCLGLSPPCSLSPSGSYVQSMSSFARRCATRGENSDPWATRAGATATRSPGSLKATGALYYRLRLNLSSSRAKQSGQMPWLTCDASGFIFRGRHTSPLRSRALHQAQTTGMGWTRCFCSLARR